MVKSKESHQIVRKDLFHWPIVLNNSYLIVTEIYSCLLSNFLACVLHVLQFQMQLASVLKTKDAFSILQHRCPENHRTFFDRFHGFFYIFLRNQLAHCRGRQRNEGELGRVERKERLRDALPLYCGRRICPKNRRQVRSPSQNI